MALISEVYAISKDTVVEELEDGIAVTRLGSDRLWILNTTGCAIWDLLDGLTPLETIISRLATRFGETPDTISQDVSAFIDRLLAASLVVEKRQ